MGSTVVRELTASGRRVRALVLPDETNIPSGCEEVFYGDVRSEESLAPFFDIPAGDDATVIHTAGIVSIASKIQPALRAVNVDGTRNIVDMCEKTGVRKLVHVSSVHAIPEKPKGEVITEIDHFDPDKVEGAYAKTKAEATELVLDAAARGLDACVVHPSGISGPYDKGRGHLTMLVTDYYNRSLTSGINGGYDFVDVRDVAKGIIECCEKGRAGECYILSNRYFTVREVLGMLSEATGHKPIRSFLPLWFVKAVAPLAETYYKILRQPPLFTKYSIYTLQTNAEFSHAKATRELGYQAEHSMKQTLADTVEWLKAEGRIRG